MREAESRPGKVFIVGAGPGAEDLITLRGLRALREADVVLYDALISAKLLDECPVDAERIFVGKRCGKHSVKQEEINRLLVSKSREGKAVLRLKGGDPLIFGRGGEEALACTEAGIEFEIIPGVSSASGAASYAGIPLTHRGTSSSVAFVTAHGERSGASPNLEWIGAAAYVHTLVIFMGSAWLHEILKALLARGLPGNRPVAVVSNATRESQGIVLGTLGTIEEQVNIEGLAAPMLIIVGDVARLSGKLNWFRHQRKARNLALCS